MPKTKLVVCHLPHLKSQLDPSIVHSRALTSHQLLSDIPCPPYQFRQAAETNNTKIHNFCVDETKVAGAQEALARVWECLFHSTPCEPQPWSSQARRQSASLFPVFFYRGTCFDSSSLLRCRMLSRPMGPSGLSCRRRRLRILILRQLRQFVLCSFFFRVLRQWRPLPLTINTQLVNLQRIQQHSNLLASLQSMYMSPITSLSILLSPTLRGRKRPNAATARHATSHAETNLTPQHCQRHRSRILPQASTSSTRDSKGSSVQP